jgi:hypothetical protein
MEFKKFSEMTETDRDNADTDVGAAFWTAISTGDEQIIKRFRINNIHHPYTQNIAIPKIEPLKLAEIKKQTKVCDVCGYNFKAEREKQMEHDHITGKFRGITCTPCNCGLGWIEKFIREPQRLKNSLAYLKSRGSL